MRTLGIDLAADPVNTAACLIDWSTGSVEVDASRVTDERIVELALTADVTGIDVPLGWPDGFVAAVSGHHRLEPWLVAGAGTVLGRDPLRFRVTDLRLRAVGHRPLSVSSDLIGVVALRAALLQHSLVAAGLEVDRSGVNGRLVETYPAAALRVWELPSRGYKGAKNAEVRDALVRGLLHNVEVLRPAADAALVGASDHVVDAFVCAVIAAGSRLGLTTTPGPEDRPAAVTEGWIHVPTVSLPEVVASATASAHEHTLD